MNVYAQSPYIKIECYHTYDESTYLFSSQRYKVFLPSSKGDSLLSYTWDRSVDRKPGSFSLTVKEDVVNSANLIKSDALGKYRLFSDNVRPLDVIKIVEGQDLVYIGVVSTVSLSSNIGGLQKIVTVSGQSWESLFDMFTVSFDVTAMCVSPKIKDIAAVRNKLTTDLLKIPKTNQGASVINILKESYQYFMEVSKILSEISAVTIANIINWVIGGDGSKNFSFENLLDTDGKPLSFKYPIACNFMASNTTSFSQWVQNLLPSNCYEYYGYIDKWGKPKLKVRECPFSSSDFDSLLLNPLNADYITAYAYTRTNSNVYTAFFPYLQGSEMSADFYQKINADYKGYQSASLSKLSKLYGYKVLNTTFIGYSQPINEDTGIAKEDTSKTSTIASDMKDLANKMREWYENLEKMYNGSVTIANIYLKDEHHLSRPAIGERAKIGKFTFYINAEKHTWNYGKGGTITYEIERGGEYTKGNFSPAKGMSAYLAESEA